jgi:hypothetical protein
VRRAEVAVEGVRAFRGRLPAAAHAPKPGGR